MSEAKNLYETIINGNILTLAQNFGAEQEYNASLENGRSHDNRDMILNRVWLRGVALIASRPELFQSHEDKVYSATSIKMLLDSVKFGPEYRSLHNTIRRFFQQDIAKSDIPERLNSWRRLGIAHREALIIDVINTICTAADCASEDFQGLRAIPLAEEEDPEAKDLIEVDFHDGYQEGQNGFAWGETYIALNKSLIISNDADKAVETACHEPLHVLDDRMKRLNTPEHLENKDIFSAIENLRRRDLTFYQQYVYPFDPLEKFHSASDFALIVRTAQRQAAEPQSSWFKQIPIWGS